jgi:hypothetical protein
MVRSISNNMFIHERFDLNRGYNYMFLAYLVLEEAQCFYLWF